jgi:hypothetical protein
MSLRPSDMVPGSNEDVEIDEPVSVGDLDRPLTLVAIKQFNRPVLAATDRDRERLQVAVPIFISGAIETLANEAQTDRVDVALLALDRGLAILARDADVIAIRSARREVLALGGSAASLKFDYQLGTENGEKIIIRHVSPRLHRLREELQRELGMSHHKGSTATLVAFTLALYNAAPLSKALTDPMIGEVRAFFAQLARQAEFVRCARHNAAIAAATSGTRRASIPSLAELKGGTR